MPARDSSITVVHDGEVNNITFPILYPHFMHFGDYQVGHGPDIRPAVVVLVPLVNDTTGVGTYRYLCGIPDKVYRVRLVAGRFARAQKSDGYCI